MIRDMYTERETEVKSAMRTTPSFPVELGLHQGPALSSFLFAIIMD